MIRLEEHFMKNANQAGKHSFDLIKRDLNPDGKDVCLYKRTTKQGKLYAYEVFFPTIKKAGTYKTPQGYITYEDSFEEYPSGGKFGKTAKFCHALEVAEHWYSEFMKGKVVEPTDASPDEEDDEDEASPVEANESASKRGRPKSDRVMLKFPAGEFSCKELAEFNQVDYSIASITLRESESNKTISFVREERRNAKGKATRLFKLN